MGALSLLYFGTFTAVMSQTKIHYLTLKLKYMFNSLPFYIYAVLKKKLTCLNCTLFGLRTCLQHQRAAKCSQDLKLSEIFCSIFRQFLIPYKSTQLITCSKKGECRAIPLQARCGPEGGYRYSSTLP